MAKIRSGGARPTTRASQARPDTGAQDREVFAKTLRAMKASAKRGQTGTGADIREIPWPDQRRLKIVDSTRAAQVEVIGVIDRTPRGDLIDGVPARPGRHPHGGGTVVVRLKDAAGVTLETRTCRVDSLRPLALELGSRIKKVTVGGEFATSLQLHGGKTHLDVDATGAKFPAVPGRAENQIFLNFLGVGDATLRYQGSKDRDYLNVTSKRFVHVDAGTGDDILLVKGGPGSIVDAGRGDDFVHVASLGAKYFGSYGRDTFALLPGMSLDPVYDLDALQDVVMRPSDEDR